MSPVSDFGLDADLTLDTRAALAAAAQVERALTQAIDGHAVRVTADASPVTQAINAAVDAADEAVTVTGDAASLTGDVTAAIDDADTAVTIEGDASEVQASIDDAVESADTEVVVEGDTDPLRESIKDGIGQGTDEGFDEQQQQAPGRGRQTGGAFATAFSRSVGQALKALPDVEIGADTSEASREVAAIRDSLLRLSDQTIGVDISAEEAFSEVGRLQERLNVLDSEDVSAAVRVDVAAASQSLSQIATQIDRVDSSVADVGVTASKSGGDLGGFGDVLDDLDLGFVAASGSGIRLRGVIQALGAAGAGVGLFQAAQAASDLEESISKANVVFGAGIEEVREFGSTSAESVGLSEAAALEATATFGNLFVALGTTKSQATDLAPEVVGLAADLASFNNLGVDETLEKLRSGLVGEIEPLRSLGISFGAAEVEAKAMELGLVAANGEITEGAKLQARWALILEQSTTAQGDFARTSDGLANQQRILSAEFQNAVTAIGQGLLPALLEGVSVARSDVIPAFQQIGEDVLPALAQVIISLLPVAGSFANILVAMSPAIVALAGALASVPPELITLIGLFAAFRKVGGSDFLSGIIEKFNFLRESTKPGKVLGGGVKDLVAANAASIGASVGLGVLALAFEENAKKAAEFARQTEAIRSSLEEALEPGVATVDAFGEVFDNLVNKGDTFIDVFAEAGGTSSEFSQAVTKGGATLEAFAEALGLNVDELGALRPFLEDLATQVQDASEQQVEAIRSTEDLSEAYVDQVIKAQTAEDGTVDYVAVLGTLTAEQSRLAEAIGVTVDETGQLVEATGPAATEADRLALSLAQIRDNGGNLTQELIGLADAASGARIAEEDMQTVADTLGVSLQDLETFVGSVNDSINQFAEDTVSSLPTIGDIIGDLGDDFSAQAFVEELEKTNEAIINFGENLETLVDFPRLQRVAATEGPEVAAAFAEAIRSGNPEIAAAAEEQLGIYGLGIGAIEDQARNEIGPKTAEATGIIANLATEAFGENFNPALLAGQQARATVASIEDEDANMVSAGAKLGLSGKEAFKAGITGMSLEGAGEADRTVAELTAREAAANFAGLLFGGSATAGVGIGVSGMAPATRAAANTSVDAVNNRSPFSRAAGLLFGGGFTGGTTSGASGMSAAAAGAANSAISKVNAKQSAATSAGFGLGAALGQGMQSGINSVAAAVAAGAAALVSAALAAARAKAKTGSPSKVFAELGEDMGLGVAVGLADTMATVAQTSADLVNAAVIAAQGADLGSPSLDVTASLPVGELASTVAAATLSGSGINVTVQAGAVVLQLPDNTAGAVAVGRAGARAVLSEITVATRRIDTKARTGG